MAPDNNRNIHPMETTATKQTSPPSRKRNRDDTSRIDPTDNNNEKTATPAVATSTTSTGTTWVPTIHRGEHASKDSVPIGDAIAEAFAKHQAVYLPHYYNRSSSTQQQQQQQQEQQQQQQQQQGSRDELQWKDLSKIYESLEDSDKKSFCIENSVANGSGGGSAASSVESNDNNKDDNDGKQDPSVPGSSFLSDSGTPTHPAGYCSFLVQNDEKALAAILERLPVTDPVARATRDSHVSSDNHGWGYEPCLWIFFGRNPNRGGGTAEDLQGRPEHTDQISHDGTWHYQLSGTKRWLLRPTPMLLRRWKRDEEENENKNKNTEKNENENETKETATQNDSKDGIDGENDNDNDDDDELPPQLRIDCQQGDVLIVNTRLWRHQTVLPPQPDPSVSYARDFWIGGVPPNTKTAPNDGSLYAASASASGAAMTNVDGLYAMDDIEEDTVLFREDDMPDCELHRSKDNPNCKVVLLEDGLQAVVSARDIKAGEFFCIPDETDDDDDQEDYEEGCEDDNEEDYEGSSGEDQDEADEE
mmetsp:Transcript_7652/g.22423  ORF Transcript_7652/g.22423 Transcript_7652/m.22423 type:complete len:531 (-) Transcript_7652:4822-6414(-)